MSDPIIISDDEDQKTPVPSLSKKPRTLSDPLPTILVLDDDPTPKKFQLASSSFSSTPSFVAETPMSDLSIVKCTKRSSNSQIGVSNWDPKPSGYLFTFSFFCLGVGVGGGARDIEADLRLAVNFFGGCHLFVFGGCFVFNLGA